jgi:hypothetical protein
MLDFILLPALAAQGSMIILFVYGYYRLYYVMIEESVEERIEEERGEEKIE